MNLIQQPRTSDLLTTLAALPQLTELSLVDCGLRDDDGAAMAAVATRLRRLSLTYNRHIGLSVAFLRTVGVNVVLSLAGGPVRAQRFAMQPVTLGACMRIQAE